MSEAVPGAKAAPSPNDLHKRDNTWPEPVAEEAYQGLVGEAVRAIEPNTEADPNALMGQILVMAGNVIGRGPYWQVENDKHHTNENALIVGETGKGRKGVGAGRARSLFEDADPEWARTGIVSGLSSGEGLIKEVRDPVRDLRGGPDDPGIQDKRRLVIEPEFARVLKAASRDGNTLSAIIRQAWDGETLHSLTKESRLSATGHHLSIIGHVTSDELHETMNKVDLTNGFVNRFLPICSRRSKALPEGGQLDPQILAGLQARFRGAIAFAQGVGLMPFDDEARRLWREEYSSLSAGREGLVGAVTNRAEAHVRRLACVYALLDLSRDVKREHLEAALAFWGYCERSARYVFGGATGDPTAEKVLTRLREVTQGLTRTQVSQIFKGNKSKAEIDRALSMLTMYGLARSQGKSPEMWFAN